jgi:hypothetical protein
MTIMVEVDNCFICGVCGSRLDADQRINGDITIEPCELCLKEAHDEGVKEGEENANQE